MGDWCRKSEQVTIQELQTAYRGLSAAQAEERLQSVGRNVLREEKTEKAWQVFLEQFEDLLVIILIAAAVISMLSGDAESTVVILAVITMNAVLGTVQHIKAQKSLNSLKQLSAPAAKVRREGTIREIPSAEVVPGDIMVLETGDLVAADARILEGYDLQVNESSLTGESVPVEKEAGELKQKDRKRLHEVEDQASPVPLAEQTNMVFSGTLVTHGRAFAVVTATGMQTEIGKIASMMNSTVEKRTPLQISLDQFGSHLAGGIMLICLVVFGLSLYRKMPVMEALMFAVALAVAAIPEALGSIVTIVQAMGTQRMAREHAIIKDLKAVESLGCVSVICSDKTGTLTQNRMSVQQIYVNSRVLGAAQLSPYDPVERMLLYVAVLTNDAGDENGDPTELALLEMGEQTGVWPEKLRKEFPRLGELPFDSERKLMSTLHQIDGRRMLLSKGAPDVLLPRCRRILTAQGLRPLTDAKRQKQEQIQHQWSAEGLRVLAMAYRELDMEAAEGRSEISEMMEQDLVWLGLTAMMDPPRVESRPAVKEARRAGIRPVMITGDSKITAIAIAEKIGLFRKGDLAVTGAELDAMTEKQLRHSLERISVYARVSPEHKLRIVEAWQQHGDIVAMTGDGVNDAPALKKADIGVAMGLSGTEVSKDAASMILADDNFSTIIKAVANGRNVYRNICNAIQFLLSGNMAGIFCVMCTTLLALPLPFAPVHLLFINLLTDSLPALAIGMEPQEEGLLDRPPRSAETGILTPDFLCAVLLQGALIAFCTMTAYFVGLKTGNAGTASTMAFSTLTLARLFHGFNCRSEQSLVRLGLSGNLWSVMAFETGVVLLAAVLFFPGLQAMFSVADLSLRQFVTVAALAFLPTVMVQTKKCIYEVTR